MRVSIRASRLNIRKYYREIRSRVRGRAARDSAADVPPKNITGSDVRGIRVRVYNNIISNIQYYKLSSVS